MSSPPSRSNGWTLARIHALGTLVDIPTAGSIFGMHRTHAYDAARRGHFPVPDVTIGKRRWVTVVSILAALGLPTDPADSDPPPRT